MTIGWTGSGNPGGRPRGSRNRAILNEEFIAALLRHFRREGERAITRMARTQPGAYCKILTLLVPRELKLEHRNAVADLSDEQLEAMIADLEERIARRAAGSDAKLIEAVRLRHSRRPWRCPSPNDGTGSWLRRTPLCLGVTRPSPGAGAAASRPPPTSMAHPFRAGAQAEEAQGAIATARVTVWTRRWRGDLCGSNRQHAAAFSLPLSGHTENPLRGAA